MRAVVQRVAQASVTVEEKPYSAIEHGLLVYLGVAAHDAKSDAVALAHKVRHLRIFNDEQGRLNCDVADAGGAVLVISAFTTLGDARKGRRPAYTAAAKPEQADPIYQAFCDALEATGITVKRGVFRSYMQVTAINDGPVCILLDTAKSF